MTVERPLVHRRTGAERIGPLPDSAAATLREFWEWACSDVLNNTLRGLLAEWLVGQALGVVEGRFRTEWAAHDLVSKRGTRVEVKSAAYVQSWAQKRLSTIQFGIGPTISWDADKGVYGEVAERSSDVYVFCLLAEQDPGRVDPLDTTQWRFFVLGTHVLNERVPSQKTVALSSLRRLGAVEVGLERVADAIEEARLPPER